MKCNCTNGCSNEQIIEGLTTEDTNTKGRDNPTSKHCSRQKLPTNVKGN